MSRTLLDAARDAEQVMVKQTKGEATIGELREQSRMLAHQVRVFELKFKIDIANNVNPSLSYPEPSTEKAVK